MLSIGPGLCAIAKYHKVGGLNNRTVLSHGSGGWKFKIKVLAGLLPSKAITEKLFQAPLLASFGLQAILAVLGSQMHHPTSAFAFIAFMWYSPSEHTRLCVSVSPSYKDTSHIELGPTLMTSLQLFLQWLLFPNKFTCRDIGG